MTTTAATTALPLSEQPDASLDLVLCVANHFIGYPEAIQVSLGREQLVYARHLREIEELSHPEARPGHVKHAYDYTLKLNPLTDLLEAHATDLRNAGADVIGTLFNDLIQVQLLSPQQRKRRELISHPHSKIKIIRM